MAVFVNILTLTSPLLFQGQCPGHGFGIGPGTVAEARVKDAINFRKRNMKENSSSGITPVYAD